MAAGASMNGGTDRYSYAKNSYTQRDEYDSIKKLIKDVVSQNLDVSGTSNVFAVADLGCSTGPNTFIAMENIIDAVEQKYEAQGQNPSNLQFQVFFNDQVGNDFNTLFATLPVDRRYYVAGVPGSFWGRLFPESSICLANSAFSLHWLSKMPKELVDKNSPAWNKGKIQYVGAKDEVVEAYAAQFEQDMDGFLNARGKEIVRGGMIVILIPGVGDEVGATHALSVVLTFFESIITDMVKEGLIDQDKLDSFNYPNFYPSVKHMSKIVEKNGCFRTVKMELQSTRNDPTITPLGLESSGILRAVMEGTLTNHFGNETVEEIFRRVAQNISKCFATLGSSKVEIGLHLLAVLVRK